MTNHAESPSRTAKDFRVSEALDFAIAARADLEVAVRMTAGWTRRQLVDIALTLAASQHPVSREPLSLVGRPPRPNTLPALGPRYDLSEAQWTDEALRRAHSAWNAGFRSDRIQAGERIYQRLRGRRKRAS